MAANNAVSGLVSGTVGLVQQAGSSAPIAIGAATGGSTVTMAGTNGARAVTGVAAGTVSATSTNAVNGSQLYATNQAVAALATEVAGSDAAALTPAVSALQSQMNAAFRDIDHLRGGVAIALASNGFSLEPGKTAGLALNLGLYDGTTAFGFQGGVRLDKTWTVAGSLGVASNGGPAGGRIGLSAQW